MNTHAHSNPRHRQPALSRLVLLLAVAGLAGLWPTPPASAQESATFFIAANGEGLEQQGDWWVQAFTVYRQTRFIYRFTSDDSAQAAIITSGNLDAFEQFDTFSGFGLFDNQFGTKVVDLRPGSYYVAVRNLVDGFNTFTLELDYPLSLANSLTASYVFNDNYLQNSSFVAANDGVYYQPFTVQKGLRYFLDGCNTGVDTLVIPAEDLNLFLNGGSYRYYAVYSGSTTDLPGFYELRLPPGNYDLVFENLDAIDHAVTYSMERWRTIANYYSSTGLRLYGPASWQFVTQNSVRLAVQKIANNSRTRTSGTLKVELWSLTTAYNGGSAYGTKMAEYRLPRVLTPGTYYPNLNVTVPLTPCAPGRRYTVLFLTEWNGTQYVIRDYLNMTGPTAFSIVGSQATRPLRGHSTARSGSATASSVPFSIGTASAARSSVTLRFGGALDPTSAGDPSHYAVQVDGRSVTIESAAYDARTMSVTLGLAQGALKSGDKVTVQWSALLDAAGKLSTGQAGPITATS